MDYQPSQSRMTDRGAMTATAGPRFSPTGPTGGIWKLCANPAIRGFTTNPTLMRKAGVVRLRGLRPRRPRAIPRPADLLRGLLRRVRRDGASGAQARDLGRQRLRQDPGHQYPARTGRRPRPEAFARRRASECHGGHDAGARSSGSPSAWTAARRATSRSSPDVSPTPASTRCRTMRKALELVRPSPEHRDHLGEPARAPEHRSGRATSAATSSR